MSPAKWVVRLTMAGSATGLLIKRGITMPFSHGGEAAK
jgi:hypothetical protein